MSHSLVHKIKFHVCICLYTNKKQIFFTEKHGRKVIKTIHMNSYSHVWPQVHTHTHTHTHPLYLIPFAGHRQRTIDASSLPDGAQIYGCVRYSSYFPDTYRVYQGNSNYTYTHGHDTGTAARYSSFPKGNTPRASFRVNVPRYREPSFSNDKLHCPFADGLWKWKEKLIY